MVVSSATAFSSSCAIAMPLKSSAHTNTATAKIVKNLACTPTILCACYDWGILHLLVEPLPQRRRGGCRNQISEDGSAASRAMLAEARWSYPPDRGFSSFALFIHPN